MEDRCRYASSYRRRWSSSAVRYGPGKARCYLQALRNSAPCTDCLLLEMWKPPPSTTRRSGYVVPQKPIRLALEEQARLGTAEVAMSRIAHDHIYALGETGHIAQGAASRSAAVSAPRSFIRYQPTPFTGSTTRNTPTAHGPLAAPPPSFP